ECNRSHDENDGRPRCSLGQNGSCATRTKSCLAALTAKSSSNVAALSALQQDHSNQEETNNNVNNRDENNHVVLWCGRGDLNPHALRRHPLKMVCLPIPPLPQVLSFLFSIFCKSQPETLEGRFYQRQTRE